MKRTTIIVDEEILLELAQITAGRGLSTSEVIREALAEYVAAGRAGQPANRRLPSFVGIGQGPTDLGQRAEDYLDQLTDPKHDWG